MSTAKNLIAIFQVHTSVNRLTNEVSISRELVCICSEESFAKKWEELSKPFTAFGMTTVPELEKEEVNFFS